MTDIHLTADRDGITEHPTAHAARSWERTMSKPLVDQPVVYYVIAWPPVLPGWSKDVAA
jgi:hypothetical protein